MCGPDRCGTYTAPVQFPDYGYVYDPIQYPCCRCASENDQRVRACIGVDPRAQHACCNVAFTYPFVCSFISLVLIIVATILAAVATSPSVSWLSATTYNGSSSNSATFSFTNTYSRDGGITAKVCPNWRNQSTCTTNPPWYTPMSLTNLAAAGGASIALEQTASSTNVLTAIALVASLSGVGIGIGLFTTVSLPFPGTTRVAPVRTLVFCTLAAACLGVIFQAAALGTWDSSVVAPLTANATFATMQWTGAPASNMPQPVQVIHSDGYNCGGAFIFFALFSLLFISFAVCASPRWCTGTRREYYASIAASAGVDVNAPNSAVAPVLAFNSHLQQQPQILPAMMQAADGSVPYARAVNSVPIAQPVQFGQQQQQQQLAYAPQAVYIQPAATYSYAQQPVAYAQQLPAASYPISSSQQPMLVQAAQYGLPHGALAYDMQPLPQPTMAAMPASYAQPPLPELASNGQRPQALDL